MKQFKSINVAIVCDDSECKSVMDIMFAKTLAKLGMKLIGMACTSPKADGYLYAQGKEIYTTRDYRDLYKLKDLDIIIELTAHKGLSDEISRTKPDHISLMDNLCAHLFRNVFQIEEKRIAERKQREKVLQENIRRLQVSYEQSIIYAQDLNKEIAERKRVEEALRETENSLQRLAENAKDLIYRMSLPEGKYEYVSPASNEIFGYSPEEMYNSPGLFAEAIDPAWRGYFEEQWNKLLNGNMPPSYEYQIISKSGDKKWVHQRNVLICDDNGKPIAIEAIATDISDRVQAEEALERAYNKLESWVEK